MKKSIGYIAPACKSMATKTHPESFTRSLELHAEGRYVESLHAVLDYFNPDIRYLYDDEPLAESAPRRRSFFGLFGKGSDRGRSYGKGRSFTVPHGSMVLKIRITEEEFIVQAPLVTLPEGSSRLAQMRRAVELNLSDLDLVHFTLVDEELHLNFRCPLELAHTHKIIYMIRELCITGDKYDDEFISKFGATRLVEPKITPYSPSEMERVIAGIRSTCQETIEAIDEYVADRKFGIAWYYLSVGLFKLSYVARPQGILDSDLDAAVESAWDDGDTQQQLIEGRAFLQRLLDTSSEDLSKSLYFVEMISSPRRASNLGNIRSNLSESYERALNASDPQELSLKLLQMIYRVYFYNDLQDDVHRVFSLALERADSKPFEEAATHLLKAMRMVMEQMGVDQMDEA